MASSPLHSPSFEAGERRIFSTYPQISNDYHSLAFAVGLRTDPNDDVQAAINRLLPLTKIVPGDPSPRRGRRNQSQQEVCMRQDCTARRRKLDELATENDPFRRRIQEVEAEINSVKQKTLIAEKSILTTEDRNEQLTTQIEELRGQLSSQEIELQQGEIITKELEEKCKYLQEEVFELQCQIDAAQNNDDNRTQSSPVSRVQVVFGKSRSDETAARGVALLDDWERHARAMGMVRRR